MSTKTASTAKRAPRRKKNAPPPAEPATHGQPPIVPNPARQAAFAASIPVLCEVFGLRPAELYGRNPAHGLRDLAVLALRKLALGAVARLGRDLELPWHAMQGEGAPEAIAPVHRASLSSFARQFAAWTGLDIDGRGTTADPAGGVARFARDRYIQIRREAMKRSGPVE